MLHAMLSAAHFRAEASWLIGEESEEVRSDPCPTILDRRVAAFRHPHRAEPPCNALQNPYQPLPSHLRFLCLGLGSEVGLTEITAVSELLQLEVRDHYVGSFCRMTGNYGVGGWAIGE